MTPLSLLLASLTLAPDPLLGSPQEELDRVLSLMEKAEREVRSLSFRFTQTATIRVTGEEQEIRGEAFFRRPSRFRVEHAAPQRQLVISDGETLWLYNPSREQVLMDSWKNWAASAGFPKGLMPFQMNTADLRERYRFQLEKKVRRGSREQFVLRLDPAEPGPWPYHLRLWVDGESGLPVRTELDSQSVRSVTEITHARVNPSLPDDLFTFEPPKGVDVLKSPLPSAP